MSAISLGILIPKLKKRKIKLPECIQDLCKESNIRITELENRFDSDNDLDKEGPFDVFLHKVTDYYNEYPKEEVKLKIQKVRDFVAKYPNMIVIDHFDGCEDMTDRKYQTEILRSCEMSVNGINVFVPKILEIPEASSLYQIKEMLHKCNVKFPILAKPLSASLADDSHTMTLILSENKIGDLPVPCLLQEFCNHSGIVYKVFVVGDQYNMCERPSIKDIDFECDKTFIFDTRNVSKTGKAFLPDLHESDPNLRSWKSCDDNPDMLNRTVIETLCQKLRTLTSLRLFGFDILIEKSTGDYALIDLNHFPGYTGINKSYFPKHLVELILKEVKTHGEDVKNCHF